MLHFNVVDAVPFRNHSRQVEDVERAARIVRVRSALQNATEAQAHNRDAVAFGLIGPLRPRADRGACIQKLSPCHAAPRFLNTTKKMRRQTQAIK